MNLKSFFPQSIKNIYHLAQAILANFIYGFPGRSSAIKIIGVTGTDGKTTTAQMVAAIFKKAGKKVALASTINFILDGKEWKNLSHFTTLSSFSVQKFISQAIKSKCEYLVLETSSHSLDQFRAWGVKYDTAVITNVTREHLDYHKTMKEYRRAKRRLFENVRVAVVNLDMEKPEEYLGLGAEEEYGYATKISNFKFQIPNEFQKPNTKFQKVVAESIELGVDYSRYKLQNTSYKLNIPGLFNVENALAATCVGLAYGIDQENIKEALSEMRGVPGRLEGVPNGRGINIIVDFALTPNALSRLYEMLTKVKKSEARIIAVFGACGERDKGKRPIIGEIVSSYADQIVLTDDEPYREDPKKIIEEIRRGIKNKKENENLWIIPDRREAIRKALSLAKPGDIVAITGMGAEESRVVGDEKIPWNDKEVISEELENMV